MASRGVRWFCGRPVAPLPQLVAALALLAAATAPGSTARAVEIPTGNPGLVLRLDTTVRYNLALRADPISAPIGNNPAFTVGEYSFAHGGVVANRLDVLVELDLVYRGRWGARVSAAGWYDDAYRDHVASGSPALAAAGIPGSYVGNEFSPYTKHRYLGPWGELLDAFAFGTFELGPVPVSLKAGAHTLYWGESLMLAGNTHGVGYAQMPLDLQKGYATPGVEAKELFRPLAAVSAQAQLTPALSLAGQVFLAWSSNLYPEGGTFLGAGDFAFNGPDGIYRCLDPVRQPVCANKGFLANAGVSRPDALGDWGLALRWRPEWLDGTAGLYYRRYTDKQAAMFLTANPGGAGPLSPAMPSPYKYQQYYGEGIDLFGVSLARQVLGVSLGAEVSWRHDTPLLAQSPGFAVAPAPPLTPVLFPHGPPQLLGNSYQARGDTLHGLLNLVGVVPGGRAFGSLSWALELTGSRWLTVRDNPDTFYGLGHGVCREDPALASAGLARGRRDGCATKGHVAAGASLAPTWFRVLPGTDLIVPLAASWTIDGNSPVTMGGNEHAGTWSAGVAADIESRYRVDLKYVDFFGTTTASSDGATVTSANGMLALLKNRAHVALTAKGTF
jgi:hypothetical protein